MGLAGAIAKHLFRAPLVVNVQDLFPQNAVDLGLLKPGPVLSFLRMLEGAVYRLADALTVHSAGNRRFLLEERGVPEPNVMTIPNWIDMEAFDAAREAGDADLDPIFEKMKIGDRKVFLFAGVIGPAQGLDIVIDAARLVADREDVVFLLLGDGTERPKLEARARVAGLNNVRFGDFVPLDRYAGIVARCYVGMVTLTPAYHTPVVPGKLMGYMAGGIAVLAALNGESDGHDIVGESGAGTAVAAGDAQAFAAAVRCLADDAAGCREMGRAGLNYARREFAKDVCVGMYDELFTELTRK